jgi:acetyltransferase-like isoleucine patch superfamily enzyme
MMRGARIGANVTVLPGITIHEDALVAAGSIVTKDVAARKIVMGTPARVVRDVPAEQLLENQ